MIASVVMIFENLREPGEVYTICSPPLPPHPDYSGYHAIARSIEGYIRMVCNSHNPHTEYKLVAVSHTIITR